MIFPRGVLKTEGCDLGFQHSPRDLVIVNECKSIFDLYSDNVVVISDDFFIPCLGKTLFFQHPITSIKFIGQSLLGFAHDLEICG